MRYLVVVTAPSDFPEDAFSDELFSEEPFPVPVSLFSAGFAELSGDFVEVLFALEDFRLSVT